MPSPQLAPPSGEPTSNLGSPGLVALVSSSAPVPSPVMVPVGCSVSLLLSPSVLLAVGTVVMPSWPATFTLTMRAPGAMPWWPARLPAMMPAMWVP